MKQITTILCAISCIAFLFPSSTAAQTFDVEDKAINVGIGFGGRFGDLGFGAIGINASMEKGIWEIGDIGVVGIGGYIGYKRGSYGVGIADFTYSSFAIGPRGTFHLSFLEVENLDVYGAIELDLNFFKINNDFLNSDVTDSDVEPVFIAGGRYSLTESIAGYIELAANGQSTLNLGASFKF